MANYKSALNSNIWAHPGRQSQLPPKSPFPIGTPAIADYGPGPVGSRGIPKPKEGHRLHQRTSSESCLIDEQPSWLDDLLNDPETPVHRRGHRRSSSDSFALFDGPLNFSNVDYFPPFETMYRNISSVALPGSLDLRQARDDPYASCYADTNFHGIRLQPRRWDPPPKAAVHHGNQKPARTSAAIAISEPAYMQKDFDGIPSTSIEKNDAEDSATHDSKLSNDKTEKLSAEADSKRAKQQFAQRSRVRKLQYIHELERNVQALQVEQNEVSAEIEFLDQQRLILSLENKALRQRIDNMAQEQLVKYLEQEVLEREVQRLRIVLYQQQRVYDQQISASASRDLDSQLATLSLNHG